MYIENEVAIANIFRDLLKLNWLDSDEINFIDGLAILPIDVKANPQQLWEAVALVYLKRGYSPLGNKGELINSMLQQYNSKYQSSFIRKLDINWGS